MIIGIYEKIANELAVELEQRFNISSSMLGSPNFDKCDLHWAIVSSDNHSGSFSIIFYNGYVYCCVYNKTCFERRWNHQDGDSPYCCPRKMDKITVSDPDAIEKIIYFIMNDAKMKYILRGTDNSYITFLGTPILWLIRLK